MFKTTGNATVATVTEARRSIPSLLERVEDGQSVILQRNSEAVGVLVSYSRFLAMQELADKVEGLEMLLMAFRREAALESGADVLVSLDNLLQRYGVDADAEDDDGDDGCS